MANDKRNHTLVQGLLRSGVPLLDIVERYKLKMSRSKRFSQLIGLKYGIESDMSDSLVQQCRGLILDESDSWEIVARPFDKFFNAGELGAAEIDWPSARVVEKLDGTCCILYYYDGWQVATLGSPDAAGDVFGYEGMTYRDLFWNTFQAKKYKVPDACWQGVTFIFELMSPYNRIVVPHAYPDLKLIGSRIASGEESSIKNVGFDIPKTYDLKSLDEVVATFPKINGSINEGYVVVDKKFNRIKVKHPTYVRIHHLKEKFTLRNAVEMIRKNETSEFLTYFPEHSLFVAQLRESLHDLENRILTSWLRHRNIQNQKEFALALQKERYPYEGVLFAMKNGHTKTIREALTSIHIDRLISLMEVKETLPI